MPAKTTMWRRARVVIEIPVSHDNYTDRDFRRDVSFVLSEGILSRRMRESHPRLKTGRMEFKEYGRMKAARLDPDVRLRRLELQYATALRELRAYLKAPKS